MHQDEALRHDSLDELWNKAQGVEMSDAERVEQRIIDVAASGKMADDRVTLAMTRTVHTLMEMGAAA